MRHYVSLLDLLRKSFMRDIFHMTQTSLHEVQHFYERNIFVPVVRWYSRMVQIKAYLPKEVSGYTDALEYVETRFCEEYAGFTTYEARGGCQVNGNIIKEPVMVVEAYFTDDSNLFRDDVNPLGKGLRDRMPNESDILIVRDGETYLY